MPGCHLPAVLVDRAAPLDTPVAGLPAGRYWGYTVCRVAALSAVFEEFPYAGGYDLAVGARGRRIGSPANFGRLAAAAMYGHAVMVLGVGAGLEYSIQGDARL